MPFRPHLAIACLLFTLAGGNALAHGHPIAIAADDPDAPRLRLCGRAEEAALQALSDRDHERPAKGVQADEPHAVFLNTLVQEVFREPQIRSQKFAQGIARSRCNDYWQSLEEAKRTP